MQNVYICRLEKGGISTFRKQEIRLVIVCFAIAVIMLYSLIKGMIRFMH
ncbi:hypothetical protein ACE3NQ_26900 [Paenibacillus terreus]|uniref:Uncharacterized protein n=1 Tax=Paenibacillus terreus TaxID=1387834 RepID=A0ABV5BG06_9BACL